MTRQSPCGWTPDFTGCRSGPCCPDVDAPANAAIKQIASDLAASLLWRLTGMRFGCCEVTVRPCKPETCDKTTLTDLIYFDQRRTGGTNMGVYSFDATLVDGQVFNIACGCPTGCCTCKADCEVRLPGPVCQILEIIIDGIPQPASNYTLYSDARLVIKKILKRKPHASVIALAPLGVAHDPSEKLCFSVPVTPHNTAPSGSCYVSSGTSNMSFDAPSVLTYNVDYTVDEPFQNSLMAISDGGLLPDDVFAFLPAGPIGPGSVVTSSSPTTDGTFAKLTVLSGATEVTTAGRLFLTQDVSFTVEMLINAKECPTCQDYNKDLGETGTWSVRYTYGEPVPAELEFAAGLYACELAKSMLGETCALPERVQSVTRQGVNIQFVDPAVLAMEGLTGIALVDTIVRALNPAKLKQRSYVWSPDLTQIRREA